MKLQKYPCDPLYEMPAEAFYSVSVISESLIFFGILEKQLEKE